ncbi:MAG: type II secretion system protein [Planctomycetota bacterium]|jgi:prepilin-type N-terminal cleavage/methylation domain-containing protein
MKRTSKKGFTIVELLTVMGVIAVLIGLLVPALALVKEHASRLQQRAQFHGIDVGLEIYKNEFGSYPESDDNVPLKEAINYCGANKLAEAMVGWDLLGFHPKSGYRSDGTNDLNGDGTYTLMYNPTGGIPFGAEGSYEETAAENLQNREVFVDMENANAFRLVDIYSNIGGFNANLNEGGFVLCDVYAKKRLAGKKAGMPILYYKARPGRQFQDSTEDSDGDADLYNDDIYNYLDNDAIVALNDPDNGTGVNDHPLYQTTTAASALEFDELIVNQQVLEATDDGSGLTGVKRPYRAESYILISAGQDGLYGTGDDIFNFEKDITE